MIEKKVFLINNTPHDDVLYFTILEPNMLMGVAPKINTIIQDYLKERTYNYIVIDLANVTRIDSAGYGVIIGLIGHFPPAERVNIFIINMSAMIKKIIDLIGFPLVMYIMPNLVEATAKIQELKKI
jgi:anti-anti-sigma factor